VDLTHHHGSPIAQITRTSSPEETEQNGGNLAFLSEKKPVTQVLAGVSFSF